MTRWQVPPARAALLARLSHGRLGWAVRLAQDDAAWTCAVGRSTTCCGW
ncbi:MAG: hypothetical protein HZY76_04345 [Anaerolineae bacterium]|nr:MAG: hypothetical protein HZY76_04345 [Anaerolineae bacterium]